MTRVESAGEIYLLSILRDVTERKKAEGALRESENRLRFLSSQLLSTQEKERIRISRELHDELGQSLSFLKLQIKAINKNLQIEQSHSQKDCQSVLKHIDEIIANVRRLSRDLSPSIVRFWASQMP